MMSSPRFLVACLLACLLVLAACTTDDETVATDDETVATDGTADAAPDDDSEEDTVAANETCSDVDLTSPPDEPVTIRVGHGAASEEPFWLMSVMPELTNHQGSWYELDLTQFRATADRLVAYQADELEAVIITHDALITGEATGALDLYLIATVVLEAVEGAGTTRFVTLEESEIDGPEDLGAKRIAIVDFGSHLDTLARLGLRAGGHDPETGAEFVTMPFPAQEDGLREGQVDVAGLPEPFYSLAHANGGIKDVFRAEDMFPAPFDLLNLAFDREFVDNNVEAICAWQADFEETMEHWQNEKEEARSVLADTDFVPLPEEVYQQITDYGRPDGGVVDIDGLEQFMETGIELGVIEEEDRVDPQVFVKPGVTAGH